MPKKRIMAGNNVYRAYRDSKGWYDIVNGLTRNLTIVHDEEWDDFVAIVNSIDRLRKKKEVE